ncbi:DUF418 domain-containing protein [Nocardia huaxiensis]|uniref:DUF418 domain-containing protein n=1 Tax=Nocardia huaxiensis TaxID=2755382 RepID=A0A7D6V610_9NOCA|nr:DUF418 domain-containing protein [Nocardia huaxiensis]QLY28332.1 DUF418 domain-containing protein [Nocardia huaxiensis]UFS98227.1 DUF418 domain-containing protein [Nocardia huaxiensis]
MPDRTDSPVSLPSAARRIDELDILRGFALFGIVVVNTLVVSAMFAPAAGDGVAPPERGGIMDRVVSGLEYAFFDGKFYLLFAFLFGYSFTLQMASAERAAVAPVPRLLRRSLALFAIGLAHVMFLWLGDILTLYAALCLILVLLRGIRARTALIAGLLLYAGYQVLPLVLGGAMTLPSFGPGFTGSFTETLAAQVNAAPQAMMQIWQFQGVPALGMFLIGLAAGKRRIFQDRELLHRWTPRALALGLLVAAPVSLVTCACSVLEIAPPTLWPTLQGLVNPFLTLSYIAGLIWLTRSRYADSVARLAPAGRMAASNYIGQSVVCMLIYSGYGLGLAGKVPPAAIVAIATTTFAAQVWFSARWLRGHAYGPVEWVLRAATNLAVPAWRKPAPPTGGGSASAV